MIAFIEVILFAEKSLITGEIIGVPPATLASNNILTLFSVAIEINSGPCFAINSLLAVTTCFLLFKA